MKQSLINLGLLKSNMKRFWPLWLAFAAAWFICLLLPMALFAPQVGADDFGSVSFAELWIVEDAGSIIGVALASIISAVLVFEYLFNQPSAMFHGALPIKRGSLFFSIYLAGLIPLVVIEIIVGLLLFGMSMSFAIVGASDAGCWLLLSLGSTFIFYSMAALCSQLSGSRSLAVALFILGNCLVVAFEAMLRVLAWSMLWGLTLDLELSTIWTSPIGGLFKYIIVDSAAPFEAPFAFTALGAYCLVGLVFVAIAFLLNKRRNFEVAGNTAAFKGIRIATKYVCGLTLALLFGFIALFCVAISNDDQGLNVIQQFIVVLMMIIGGFVGIFFGEAYSQKSARVLDKTWKSGLALAVLSIAFVMGCTFDVAGVQGYTPVPSDVKSVTVRVMSTETVFTGAEHIADVVQLHGAVLDAGKPQDLDTPKDDVTFTYKMNDGSTVMRSYKVENPEDNTLTSLEKQISELVNSQDAVLARYEKYLGENLQDVSVEVTLDQHQLGNEIAEKYATIKTAQLDEFLNGPFKKDLNENGAGAIYFNNRGETYKGTLSLNRAERNEFGTYQTDWIQVTLSEEHTPNSLKWIAKNVTFE